MSTKAQSSLKEAEGQDDNYNPCFFLSLSH